MINQKINVRIRNTQDSVKRLLSALALFVMSSTYVGQ